MSANKSNTAPFRWYNKPAFDTPHLNSPQPCSHGAGCNYRIMKDGVETIGCCAFVHPGEEGNGRRLFEERSSTNEAGETVVKKACVRLTGRAGFYERRRLRLSWPAWCERQKIPYTPNPPDSAPSAPLSRARQNRGPQESRGSRPVVVKAADRLAAAQALLNLMSAHGIGRSDEISQIERGLGIEPHKADAAAEPDAVAETEPDAVAAAEPDAAAEAETEKTEADVHTEAVVTSVVEAVLQGE